MTSPFCKASVKVMTVRRVFSCWLVLCTAGTAFGHWVDDVSALAVNYFQARDVKSVTVFSCWDSPERHTFFRTMNGAGMMVQFVHGGSQSLTGVHPNPFAKGGMLVDAMCENVLAELWPMGRVLNNLLLVNVFWLFLENGAAANRIHEVDETTGGLPLELGQLYNDRFRTLETLPYTNVVIGLRDDLAGSWTLFEVFKPHRNALLSTELIVAGYEPARDCEVLLRKRLLAGRSRYGAGRRNLQGYAMPSIIAITSPEYFKGIEDHNDVHDLYAKANFPFIRELAYDMNFTLNMVQVEKGGLKTNGTFNGLMGKFQNRTVELGCMAILMRAERLEAIDYAAVTMIIKSSIIFRQPPLSVVSNIFELPFSVGVWVCCFALMAIYWLAMVALRWLGGVERFAPVESLMYLIGVMCQRGFDLASHWNGTRLMMFSFQLTSFFIVTSYSASIVALLQSPSRAITTVGDLVRSPLQAGVMDTIYERMYYVESTNPEVQELYRRKIKPHGDRSFIDPNIGIARVKHELYAFEAEVNAAYKAIKETFAPAEVCKLHELEAIKLPPFGVPIVKGSKYRELFRQRLQWQREVGIMKRFNIIWIHRKPQCENPTAGYTSVGWVEMRYLYFFLAVGFLAALLLLGAEWTWHSGRTGRTDLGRKILGARKWARE